MEKKKKRLTSWQQILRWLLIGAGIIALIVLVVTVASTLMYSNYMQGWRGY